MGETFIVIMMGGSDGEQFKATKLWHLLVEFVRCNVSLKTKRYLLRNDNCFTGSNAVDVVFRFLTEEASNLVTNNITRANAIKVCQALLDQHVFKPSSWRRSCDHGQKLTFEDSPHKFYYLVDITSKTCVEKGDTPCINAQKLFVQAKIIHNLSVVQSDLGDQSESETQLFTRSLSLNPQQRKAKGFFQRLRNASVLGNKENIDSSVQTSPLSSNGVSACKQYKRSTTLSSLHSPLQEPSKKSVQIVSSSTIISDAIWKKMLLSRLLLLLNIPYIEELAKYLDLEQEISDSESFQQMFKIFSLNQSSRFEQDWYKLASKCISKPDHLPSNNSKKKTMFKAVVNHYSENTNPLIPNEMKEIFITILGLLKESKYFQMAQALQLSIMLLPLPMQKQLYSLLRFMQTMSEDTDVILDKTCSNQSAVMQHLSNAVLNIASLGKDQTKIVLFMMHHCDVIFSRPDDLKKEIEQLFQMSTKNTKRNSAFIFCQQMSPFSLSGQAREITDTQPTSPSKEAISEKKRINNAWVRRLHKNHPITRTKFLDDKLRRQRGNIVTSIVTNI